MVSIKIIRRGVSAIGRRGLQEVGRIAIMAAGIMWMQKFLPLHFTRAAYIRYKYEPRAGDYGSPIPFKGSYAEAKIRRRSNGAGVRSIGEQRPFVWSGRSREQSKNSHVEAVSKNYQTYEARVRIPTNTLNFLRGRINADKEIRATTKSEEQVLEAEFAGRYGFELGVRTQHARSEKTIAA